MSTQDNDDSLAIRVTSVANQNAAIRAIRAATSLPISEVKSALESNEPLTVAKLYGTDHEQVELEATALFAELDNAGAEFDIILNEVTESRHDFYNLMRQWHETNIETRMLSDLELGQPDIETLKWLRSTGSDEVFQKTIQQIVDGSEFKVDEETLEWAKRMRNDE